MFILGPTQLARMQLPHETTQNVIPILNLFTKRLGNARVEVCDNHGKLSVQHVSDVKQVTPLECTVQLILEITGMGHKCTLTVNPDRIRDLQWQAMDRTLPENLAEITGKASETSEITSTWL